MNGKANLITPVDKKKLGRAATKKEEAERKAEDAMLDRRGDLSYQSHEKTITDILVKGRVETQNQQSFHVPNEASDDECSIFSIPIIDQENDNAISIANSIMEDLHENDVPFNEVYAKHKANPIPVSIDVFDYESMPSFFRPIELDNNELSDDDQS